MENGKSKEKSCCTQIYKKKSYDNGAKKRWRLVQKCTYGRFMDQNNFFRKRNLKGEN